MFFSFWIVFTLVIFLTDIAELRFITPNLLNAMTSDDQRVGVLFE